MSPVIARLYANCEIGKMKSAKMPSKDAIILGLGFLRGPRSRLSFGGEGAQMAITPRAQRALDELLEEGYAELAEPDDQIVGRRHYRGTMMDPHLGQLAKESGLNPFGKDTGNWQWKTFSGAPEDVPRDRVEAIRAAGLFIGERDPNMNKAFDGKWMVCAYLEARDPYPTDDAREGLFCIVGECPNALAEEAMVYIASMEEDISPD